ncbi:Ybp1/Ybp2 [Kluyveromyces lactis]|nr:Ybp1/Ybp2 [Kluyveromyces lactis]
MPLEVERFKEIEEKLLTAFVEEKSDIITLVTILDLYSEEVNFKGSLEQKHEYLSEVLSLLQQNKDVVYEIGWDLPKILIKFIHWGNNNHLRADHSKKFLTVIMKCFNEVALFGNPKECFFAGCELMSSLRINDESLVRFIVEEEPVMDSENEDSGDETYTEDEGSSDKTEEEEEKNAGKDLPTSKSADESTPDLKEGYAFYGRLPQEVITELRFYSIIELMGSTLKRIVTLHPSKFLSEAVEAFSRFNLQNNEDVDDCLFILRRLYSFIRGYIPPSPPPDTDKQFSAEELEEIKVSEEVLQRKLLCNILTSALHQLLKARTCISLLNYHSHLQGIPTLSTSSEYLGQLTDILSRYYQLATSFDIDVSAEFKRLCIDESVRIYRSLPKDSEIKSDEELKEITNFVYQLAYTYEVEKIANVKEILLDPAGILILRSFSNEDFLPPSDAKITLQEAIYMYLRFVTPSMFSALFENRSSHDLARTWILFALTNNSTCDLMDSLKDLPSYIITVYLQTELIRACLQINDNLRRTQFSILTRILCLLPEDFAFNFIRDTLLSCPYEQAKCCALAILKDMMQHERKVPQKTDEDDLAKDMEKLKIKNSPPPLPSRAYMLLNDDRIATLHSVTLLAIDSCAADPESKKVKTLLTYLNFLNAFLNKWDSVFLKEICDAVNDKLIKNEKVGDKDEPHYSLLVSTVASITSKL